MKGDLTITLMLGVVALACSSATGTGQVCEPGETQTCVCPGQQGAQECLQDGTGWGPCNCGDGTADDAIGDVAADAVPGDVGADAVPGDVGADAAPGDVGDGDLRQDTVTDSDVGADVVDTTGDVRDVPLDVEAGPDTEVAQDTVVAPDSLPDAVADADTGTAAETCEIVTCVDYVTCATYETCGPCPEPPPEKCNGVDDDCDSEPELEGAQLDCEDGYVCKGGVCCADECEPEGKQECVGTTHFRSCGNYDADGCLEWSTSECDPGVECTEGSCACNPKTCLELGKECGTWSDGCGGSLQCGTCSDPDESCQEGICACTIPCGGGCCESSQVCRDDACCTPHDHEGCHTDGNAYWYDSCGNREESKEQCTSGQVCFEGACCTPKTCTPEMCGEYDDGCGSTIDCADVQTDPNHCGVCQHSCGGSADCVGGQCDCDGDGVGKPPCPAGFVCDGISCACDDDGDCGFLQTCNELTGLCECGAGSPQVCLPGGQCGSETACACTSGADCPEGLPCHNNDDVCVQDPSSCSSVSCTGNSAGKDCCAGAGGGCTDLQTDEQHCGQCAISCGENEECTAGECTCGSFVSDTGPACELYDGCNAEGTACTCGPSPSDCDAARSSQCDGVDCSCGGIGDQCGQNETCDDVSGECHCGGFVSDSGAACEHYEGCNGTACTCNDDACEAARTNGCSDSRQCSCDNGGECGPNELCVGEHDLASQCCCGDPDGGGICVDAAQGGACEYYGYEGCNPTTKECTCSGTPCDMQSTDGCDPPGTCSCNGHQCPAGFQLCPGNYCLCENDDACDAGDDEATCNPEGRCVCSGPSVCGYEQVCPLCEPF